MDRKTALATGFTGLVVAAAVAAWAGERYPDASSSSDVAALPRARPPNVTAHGSDWAQVSAWLEPGLDPASLKHVLGRSWEGERLPFVHSSSEAEPECSLRAWPISGGALVVHARLGDWAQYIDLHARLEPVDGEWMTAHVGGNWKLCLLRPNGSIVGGELKVNRGKVTVDSLDWTAGRSIGVKLELNCSTDDPARWIDVVVQSDIEIGSSENEARLQPPK